MSFLTDAELADMVTVVGQAMPDTCVIQSSTYVGDGAGGGTVTWTAVAGGTVACRCDPGAAKRTKGSVIAEAEGIIYPYIFTLPTTAPIATDRIILYKNQTYQIQGMSDNPSWILCRRAYCDRVSNAGD